MRLSQGEYYQFLGIHIPLIYYVGIEKKVLPKNIPLEEFRVLPVQDKITSRNLVYENPRLIDQFVRDNPFNLSEEDRRIALGFKNFRKGQFFVYKYLKNHTIFLQEEYAFGVKALNDPLQYLLGPDLPKMVEAVLLPFKGEIVYDGMLMGTRISFGRNISRSIKADYDKAKSLYGIITQLPLPQAVKQQKVDERQLLEAYMKTKASRDQYYYEIEELINKNDQLYNHYLHLLGKINSRNIKKKLKSIGIKDRYYAVHEDTVVASDTNQAALEKSVRQVVGKNHLDAIYYFKI